MNIGDLARVAARTIKQRYPWVDIEDAQQEAALAMLRALPNHRPDRGELEPFLMYAAWYRAMVWVWQDRIVRQRPDRNCGWATTEQMHERLVSSIPGPDEALRRGKLARAVALVLARYSTAAQIVITQEGRLGAVVADSGADRRALVRQVRAGREMLREVARSHMEDSE